MENSGEHIERRSGEAVASPRARLLGRWDLTVDEKGRLSVSTSMRRLLGDTVVLYYSLTRNCLEIIPVETFYALMDDLYAQGGREAITCISGSSSEASFDGHGRLLLPASLREPLCKSGNVVVTGDFDRLCVWTPESWANYNRKTMSEGSNANVLAKLAL